MALEVIWGDEAREDFRDIASFLLDAWGDEAARRFAGQVEKKATTLASMPYIGKRHEVLRAVRSIPVEPYHLLYYTVRGQTLHILNLVDNRRQ